MSFASALEQGKAGETDIARWLNRKGYSILPVYETILETGKGPQLYTPGRRLIAPDLLVYRGDRVLWIEAKHKATFTMYRKTGHWQTGVDLRHWQDYCLVDDEAPWPVWLLFLHEGGKDVHTGQASPSGLFGQLLSRLREQVDHVDRGPNNNSRSGMVYWNMEALVWKASLDEVRATG